MVGILPVIVAGCAAALLAYSLLGLIVREERGVSRRLAALSEYEAEQVAAAEPLLRPFRDRVLLPSLAAVSGAVRHVSPAVYTDELRWRLVRAGHPRNLTVEALLALKSVCALAAGLLALIVLGALRGGMAGVVLLASLVAIGGFFLPDVWLRSVESSRKLAVRRALPDMLDMLTISVEAGLGFDSAVAKLVANGTGPLAEEFGRMLKEMQAGIPRAEAFRHLSARTDVPEVATFTTSMVQADVFGISVSKVLRSQAKEMRTKRRQHAEEAAQKAPVKIVFPLVLCILPATLIVILGPAIVTIGRAFGMID
jgi:tight adherence protein C